MASISSTRAENLPPPMPLYHAGGLPETTQPQLSETLPPQTGTTLPFIWPPPHHLQTPPPFQEPVLPSPPAESLLAREVEMDAQRCEEPSKHQGVLVFDSLTSPPHDKCTRARGATSVQDMPPWYVTSCPDDDTLLFESRFESGNLRSAEKIQESEYNLQLAFDINTDRHTQWFYFRMSNLRKGRPYKLNMQNLMKTEAVYNLGMQPLVYSEVRAETEDVGWYRAGSNACYFKNQLTRAGSKPFWTLTFTVETMFDRDTLYLAHCFPYRYTDLQRYLSELEASPLGRNLTVRRRTLCQTLAGNDCDMLTITSPRGDQTQKKGIVISARVHPGETNASWMMKGVLQCLTADTIQAAALRDKFVFKVVPMLNPDGVIVGNYRCSLAGGDLNRQYEDPKRELFPEVLNLKQMIANFGMAKEVLLYVDLHGHSKKSNIFMYGVQNPTDESLYMRERVIPTLLDRASPLFNLGDCSFDVGKGKEGCGRVVMRKQLGIVNAYTMEASFMGADRGEFQGVHFNQGHFESMGRTLCEVLLQLVDPEQGQVEQIVTDLVEKYPIDQSRVVLPRQDDNGDNNGSSSDNSDSDGSIRLSAKPSRPPKSREAGTPRQGARSAGPRNKRPIISRGGVGSDSDSDEPNRSGGRAAKDGDGKHISSKVMKKGGSKEQPTALSKAAQVSPKPPQLSSAASPSDSGAAVPSRQKPPPAKPPPPRPTKPVRNASATKSPASKAVAVKPSIAKSGSTLSDGTQHAVKNTSSEDVKIKSVQAQGVPSKGVPPKDVAPKVVPPKAVPPKGVAPKGVPSKDVPPKGVPPKGVPPKGVSSKGVPPRDVVVAPAVKKFNSASSTTAAALKIGQKGDKITGKGGNAKGKVAGATKSASGSACENGAGAKKSKAAPVILPQTRGGGREKVERVGGRGKGSSDRTVHPPPLAPSTACRPARRPASSPMSRSVSSPRRQAVAKAAVQRSPSAPPKTVNSLKRVGLAGGAGAKGGGKAVLGGAVARPGKEKGSGGSGNASEKSSPRSGKGKTGGKRNEPPPLPSLRSKSASAAK